MAELTLKQILKPWGAYTSKGNVVALYDNDHLRDPQFLEICKKHAVKIQLDLFTDIPNDKE